MSIKVFSVGFFPLPVASPVFDFVRLFAINTNVRHNGSTKITVCLYIDCLSLAKGTVEEFTSARYKIKNLEIYVTAVREKEKKKGRLTHL